MLSDWESSLTELSDSEDEYQPAPSKKKKQKPPVEYKQVTSSLQPYRTTTYTTRSLYDQIIDGTIDLDPEYQRDIVWGEAKQSGLIDSILRNFYMPPVIFAVTTNDDGTQTRTCIDGKQRLTSIQLFMDGLIPHKDIVDGRKFWFKKDGTEQRFLLSKPMQQTFANKQVTCIEYDGLTNDQEREIFQRVQLGVALTVAERMQAIPGPWPSLIREVQSIVLGEDGFGEDLDWGHDRGRDFQCLATILCLLTCHSGTSFPTTPKLEKWLSSPDPVDQKTRTDVLETFRIFIALVKDKRYNTAFKKPSRVSPVEFTMTGVLISRYKKTHSLTQLSNAIWQMRADVRKKFSDVRANTKVVKVMFDFLKRGFKDAELASDKKGDTPAAIAIKSAKRSGIHVGRSRTSSPEPAPKLAHKRRRLQVAASSDDSDSDDEAVPAKRRASAPNLPASSSRAAAAKATASKAAGARKVSAPAATKAASTASTLKTATKTSNKSAKVSQPQDGQLSPSLPNTSASARRSIPQTLGPKPLTTRKTMTSMSAAADSLFSPVSTATGSTATGSSPQASRIGGAPKKATKATPSATVKMEVDPSLDRAGPPDDNAMAVDGPTNTAQPASTPRSHLRSAKPTSPTANGPLEPHPELGDIDTSAIEQMLRLNMNSPQATPIGSPVVPPPPAPPAISALSARVLPVGQSASAALSRQSTVISSPSAQASRMPPPKSPVLPRTDCSRARSRDRSSNGDWDMDRGRDRSRTRSRDRYAHRDRDRSRDRRREPPVRDWKLPEAERRRRERSLERDRYRYPSRSRGR
ncbi:hypothetical protein LXA43DRAFT_79996 [Ganoderma leucocontextum]|nr:hypothetical protein LXA43DRAFT_79996 [Ganoderma leucocontextum]